MIKTFTSISITAALLIFSACDKKPSDEQAKSTDAPEKTKPTDTPEPKTASVKDELADPSDVDEGLRSLKLTVGQNEKIKAWMDKQEEAIDPSDMAAFISSILTDDQQEAFRKLVQTPEDLQLGDDGDQPE